VIDCNRVSARIGEFQLRDVTFTVPAAGYGVVIGPAGSGKTTLLEAIAGIVPLTAGTLSLDGHDMQALPPERRGIGFVYQHGLLFPHLTVEENITYGATDREFARHVAERLGAATLLARPVRGLSGGERQLVALARAVAIRPSVLLLDEPFSALDHRRRSDVRRELRQLHRELTMTVLQVTHDFTEAGLLGDVAILLDDGRVLQVGPPNTVFRQPASPYVADFLGADNVLAGEACEVEATRSGARQGNPRVAGVERRMMEFRTGKLTLYGLGDAPGAGHAVIRAEEVLLSMEPTSTSARNMFAGRVVELLTLGALTRVTLDIQGTLLVAALTTRSASDLSLEIGTPVFASFKAMAVHLC